MLILLLAFAATTGVTITYLRFVVRRGNPESRAVGWTALVSSAVILRIAEFWLRHFRHWPKGRAELSMVAIVVVVLLIAVVLILLNVFEPRDR